MLQTRWAADSFEDVTASSYRPVRHLAIALSLTLCAVPARAQQPVASADAQTDVEDGVARWSNRPRFQFGDVLRIDLHARIQSDVRLRDDANESEEPPTLEERLSVPRRRVGVEGVLFDRVEFQIEREIRDDNPWRDVYADVRLHPSFRVRAGQFKVPFSLEQTTSAYELDFISRTTVVNALSPGRDVGVMVHGRVANRVLRYEAGMFRFGNGVDLHAISAERTVAARLTVAPLRDGKSRGSDDLQFAVAVLQNDLPEGRSGLPGQLIMGPTFFEKMFVNGTRTRFGLSGEWHAGRTSLKGELIHSADTRRGQALDNGDLSDLIAQGWYLSAVRTVVKTRRLGDLDVAARFDRIAFGSANTTDEPFLNPRAEHVAPIGKDAWTFGTTWLVNRWVKVMANTSREQVVDSLQLLSTSGTPIWTTVLRFQVAM